MWLDNWSEDDCRVGMGSHEIVNDISQVVSNTQPIYRCQRHFDTLVSIKKLFKPIINASSTNFCPNSNLILSVFDCVNVSLKKGSFSMWIVIVPLFTDLKKFEIDEGKGSGLPWSCFAVLFVIPWIWSFSRDIIAEVDYEDTPLTEKAVDVSTPIFKNLTQVAS